MKKQILALALFAATALACQHNDVSVQDPGTSKAETKAQLKSDAADCVRSVTNMLAQAQAKAVTAQTYANFSMSFHCTGFTTPADLFTDSQTVRIDYLNPVTSPGVEDIRLDSLRIWFTHQQLQYKDPTDPNVIHEVWSTWKNPSVHLTAANLSRDFESLGTIPNYAVTNPLEQVKTQAPSYSTGLGDIYSGDYEIDITIQDPNEFAKTWVGELSFSTVSKVDEQHLSELRSIYNGIRNAQAYIAGFNDYNNVAKWQELLDQVNALGPAIDGL
jgi:hypothetical protein